MAIGGFTLQAQLRSRYFLRFFVQQMKAGFASMTRCMFETGLSAQQTALLFILTATPMQCPSFTSALGA
jgi:hypothetical protein